MKGDAKGKAGVRITVSEKRTLVGEGNWVVFRKGADGKREYAMKSKRNYLGFRWVSFLKAATWFDTKDDALAAVAGDAEWNGRESGEYSVAQVGIEVEGV